MISVRIFFCFSLFFLWIETGRAEDSHVDISSGIVFSSNNQTILEDPAFLAPLTAKVLDAALFLDGKSFQGGEVSYTRGNRSWGFGLLAQKQDSSVTAGGGIGGSIGRFQFGLNALFGLDQGSSRFDAAVRLGGTRGFALALVLHDVFNFSRNYTIGLGAASNSLRGEINFDISQRSDLSLRRVDGSVGLVWEPMELFSVGARDYFQLMPNSSITELDLEYDVNIWLGRAFAVYGRYHSPVAQLVLGIKALF